MDGEKLKACPFCGRTVNLQVDGKLMTFICEPGSSCIGSGLGSFGQTEKHDAVIAAWNRRTPASGEAELVAALREALLNAKGFLDTPISRRRNAGDSFFKETVKSINTALALTKEPTHAV